MELNPEHCVVTARYWADRHAGTVSEREHQITNPMEMLALAQLYATLAVYARLDQALSALSKLGVQI